MVYQNEKCTVTVDIDERFVIGCDEDEYDIILNLDNIKRNEPHDALRIIAKTDKTLRIAIVVRHKTDFVWSVMLHDDELFATFDKNAITLNLRTGEILHYEKDAVQEEFKFSILDEILE